MRSLPIAVVTVTGALALNGILAVAQGPTWVVAVITMAGPLLLTWLAVAALNERPRSEGTLEDDEW
jgi:threonine/homoserine/homoserine lactone efflux protein